MEVFLIKQMGFGEIQFWRRQDGLSMHIAFNSVRTEVIASRHGKHILWNDSINMHSALNAQPGIITKVPSYFNRLAPIGHKDR